MVLDKLVLRLTHIRSSQSRILSRPLVKFFLVVACKVNQVCLLFGKVEEPRIKIDRKPMNFVLNDIKGSNWNLSTLSMPLYREIICFTSACCSYQSPCSCKTLQECEIGSWFPMRIHMVSSIQVWPLAICINYSPKIRLKYNECHGVVRSKPKAVPENLEANFVHKSFIDRVQRILNAWYPAFPVLYV